MNSPVADALTAAANAIDVVEGGSTSKLNGSATSTPVTPISNGAVPNINDSPKSRTDAAHSVPVSDVLHRLEHLIVTDEWQTRPGDDHSTTDSSPEKLDNKRKKSRAEAPKLSELSRNVVTSYSLRAYVDMLSPHHRQGVAAWLHAHTSQALAQIFKFPKCQAHMNDDSAGVDSMSNNGVIKACRLALQNAYPTLAECGYQAFVNASPVVYISPSARLGPDVISNLRVECGIENIVTAPAHNSPLSQVEARLDHDALYKRMLEDKEKGLRPLLVVACVGSTIFAQNDMVSKLIELRKTIPFWLHCTGNGLATLGRTQPPENLTNILSQVDSMTLKIGQWLGVPALPSVIVHRPVDGARSSYQERVAVLPLWVAIHTLGAVKLAQTLDRYVQLNKLMVQELSHFANIRMIGIDDSHDYAQKVARNILLPPSTLVFKYTLDDSKPEATERQAEDQACGIDQDYLDCLNLWIGQGLFTECPAMALHFIELHDIGTALRFCPLETAAQFKTTDEHVRQFGKQLSDVLNIVDATVRARRALPTMLTQYRSLRLVNLHKWAGAGAVVYVPSIVDENQESTPQDWSSTQKQQISHLNIELVHTLRSSDSAFSTGEAVEGVSCVKFGMLADERDLADLIRLVAQRGHELEQSSRYLESLAELVRQGMEAANDDLRRENEEKLMREGVMRQLPMVGSLLNWWSPMPPEHHHIKGRSFDLKTGRIMTTDARQGTSTQLAPAAPQKPHEPVVKAVDEKGQKS